MSAPRYAVTMRPQLDGRYQIMDCERVAFVGPGFRRWIAAHRAAERLNDQAGDWRRTNHFGAIAQALRERGGGALVVSPAGWRKLRGEWLYRHAQRTDPVRLVIARRRMDRQQREPWRLV